MEQQSPKFPETDPATYKAWTKEGMKDYLLEELKKLRSAPTADELYEKVRRRLPRISPGTVYRNLEALSRRGLVEKLQVAGTQKRFDASRHPHYHARCVRCGRVGDVQVLPLSSVEETVRDVSDYGIVGP